MAKRYFEDCAVGDRTTTPPRRIDEEDVVAFAAVSGDWMPIHTDAEYGRQSVVGQRIAHGILVLEAGCALLAEATGAGLIPSATTRVARLDRVRFRAPTLFGDQIRTVAEITDARAVDESTGSVTVKGSIVNQREEKAVAFTMELLVARRPPGGAATEGGS